MNVLVTGGTGMLGSYLLAKLIADEHNIFALRRKNSNIKFVENVFTALYEDGKTKFSKINWVEGDITNYHSVNEAMQNIDFVYHSAAMISFKPLDKERMVFANVQGTANMVNAALSNNIKKFCHISSIGALGNAIKGELIDEDTERKKNTEFSDYSVSKFRSENEVWRGIAEGLNAVIINPSVILGAWNWTQGSSRFFKTIYDQMKFYTNGATGFVDVNDVVNIMIKLTESDISNERFILNSENISYKTLFSYIANSLGKKQPKIQASNFMLHLLKFFDIIRYILIGKEPRITKFTLKSAQKKSLYSNAKIKKAINYKFIPIKKAVTNISERFLSEIKTNL